MPRSTRPAYHRLDLRSPRTLAKAISDDTLIRRFSLSPWRLSFVAIASLSSGKQSRLITTQGWGIPPKLENIGGLWQVHVRLPQVVHPREPDAVPFLFAQMSRLVLPWGILLILAATVASTPHRFAVFFSWTSCCYCSGAGRLPRAKEISSEADYISREESSRHEYRRAAVCCRFRCSAQASVAPHAGDSRGQDH